MTLLISCTTDDYAIQVSDRRLIYPDGSLADDHTNKAIIFKSHLCFSYTGLAVLDNRNTAIWFRDELANASGQTLYDKCVSIARNATRALRQIDAQHRTSHTFLGTGWIKPIPAEEDREYLPIALAISNVLDEYGNKTDEPRPYFVVRGGPFLMHDGLRLDITGQPIAPERRISLERNIRRAIRRGIGPSDIARLMEEEIRHTARINPSVGASLMIVCLPLATVLKDDHSIWMGRPSRTKNTFMYLASDATVDAVDGPAVVLPGGGGSWQVKMRG